MTSPATRLTAGWASHMPGTFTNSLLQLKNSTILHGMFYNTKLVQFFLTQKLFTAVNILNQVNISPCKPDK